MHPSLTEGWIELGNVPGSQEKYEPALASYAPHGRGMQRPTITQPLYRYGHGAGVIEPAMPRRRRIIARPSGSIRRTGDC